MNLLINKGRIRKDGIFEKLVKTLRKHGAVKVHVFGSYARGEEGPESDLDIIVEFSNKKSLMDIVGIEQELTDLIGVKVDLLTEKSISPYLIDTIKEEMVEIY